MDLEVGLKLWAESEERIVKSINGLKPVTVKPIFKPVFGVNVSTGPGTPLIIDTFDQPSPGRMWFIHRLGVFGSDGHTPLWQNSAGNTAITAGAGSRTINNGQPLVSINITLSTAPTAAGTVTITGVNSFAGGNTSLIYNIAIGQTTFAVNFSPPILANPIGNAITVTFSATGAVGNMAVQGGIPPASAPQGDVEIYVGSPPDIITGELNPPLSDLILTVGQVPDVEKYGHRSQAVHANEHIYAVAYGIPVSQQIVLSAFVAEYPVEVEEARVI